MLKIISDSDNASNMIAAFKNEDDENESSESENESEFEEPRKFFGLEVEADENEFEDFDKYTEFYLFY